MTNREYWYWICNIPGFGNAKIRMLLERYQTPELIYQIGTRELEQIPYIRKKTTKAGNGRRKIGKR